MSSSVGGVAASRQAGSHCPRSLSIFSTEQTLSSKELLHFAPRGHPAVGSGGGVARGQGTCQPGGTSSTPGRKCWSRGLCGPGPSMDPEKQSTPQNKARAVFQAISLNIWPGAAVKQTRRKQPADHLTGRRTLISPTPPSAGPWPGLPRGPMQG